MKLFGSRSDASTITTYARQGRGVARVQLASLPTQAEPSQPVIPRDVSAGALEERLKALRSARRQELEGGASVAVAPVLSKDASVNPAAMHMAYDPKDPQSLDFIAQMAHVGRVEGFRVIADAEPAEVDKLRRQLPAEVQVFASPGGHDAWTEDHGEFTRDGEIVIPALMPADVPLDDWIIGDRARRYHEMAQAGQPRPRADYATQGLINDRRSQEELVSNALATDAPVKMAVSYVEGGNLLPGTRADGTPFVLVGRDSVAITRELMREQKNDDSVSDVEVLAQIEKDYGLPAGSAIPVEQPCDFHGDMDMALAGPGRVLLNDARQVAELQKEWLNQGCFSFGKGDAVAKIDAHVQKVAIFEDLVEKDLQAAGLEVIRVAGDFPASGANDAMNFLNMRQGTNEEGQAFAVALGGDERAEQAFAQTLLQEVGGYERVHFLNRDLTPETLKYKGGIKCRTKVRA